jgi:hypothetical protein
LINVAMLASPACGTIGDYGVHKTG